MPKPAKSRPRRDPEQDDTPAEASSLPATLTATLPSSNNLFNGCGYMLKYLAAMEKELDKLRKKGEPIRLARAFVVIHRLKARLDAINGDNGAFNRVFSEYKEQVLPGAFEAAGITHVPLDEGFRVGLSSKTWVSIPPEKREAAYQWLRDNGLESLITSTVNSSTLSSTARTMMEESNKELPDTLFNVAIVPNTSVTQLKGKQG